MATALSNNQHSLLAAAQHVTFAPLREAGRLMSSLAWAIAFSRRCEDEMRRKQYLDHDDLMRIVEEIDRRDNAPVR